MPGGDARLGEGWRWGVFVAVTTGWWRRVGGGWCGGLGGVGDVDGDLRVLAWLIAGVLRAR